MAVVPAEGRIGPRVAALDMAWENDTGVPGKSQARGCGLGHSAQPFVRKSGKSARMRRQNRQM
jgi:hypothetical protein